MNKKIMLALVGGIAIAVLLAFIFLPIKVSAAQDSDTTNITVQIATKVAVDVNPAAFAWLGVTPGSVGGPNEEALGPGYFAIQIENIGSRNITKVWFNATYPASRPFASGTNSTYDAGNFVVLAKEGGTFYFPNRLEFNETRSLVYLRDPAGNLPPSSSYSYGRFRNSSYEYFWMISRGANCAGQSFYIGTSAHTETQTGTTNFQGATTSADGVCVVTLAASSASGWCYADLAGSTDTDCNLFDYTIYVKNQTYDQVFFVHWNKDFLSTTDTANNKVYFFQGNLVPGNSTVAEIRVFVPYGVYEGYSKKGTLTVIVSDV